MLKKSAADDIASVMQKNLASANVDELKINKIASAIDCLNSAADSFEIAGFEKEAELVTAFLEVLAKKKRQKSKKSDSATKGLDSNKMLKNLKEKGIMFNADDTNYAADSDCQLKSPKDSSNDQIESHLKDLLGEYGIDFDY